MKSFSKILILAWAMNGMSAWAQAETPSPQLLVQKPDVIFSPVGFDDNDNAQVVVAGRLSNTCFKVGPIEKRVDLQNKQIIIKDQAYYYNGSWCIFVMVPYFKSIDLGPLPAGEYEVFSELEGGKLLSMNRLKVTVARSPNPDDFLYAPIRDVSVDSQGPNHLNPSLIIRGSYPSTCMGLKEIRTIYSAGSVVEVLPIAEMRDDPSCKDASIPFEYKVNLDRDQLKDLMLFHVRSLNGQAINTVMNF